MHRAAFLRITALAEVVTGLVLLLWPALPLALLLGLTAAAPETLLVARVAGTALIAIGVTSGLAHEDGGSLALQAVLVGVLAYDVGVTAVLVYAGIGLHLAGILLWPAVLAHTALAVWCVGCLRSLSGDGQSEPR